MDITVDKTWREKTDGTERKVVMVEVAHDGRDVVWVNGHGGNGRVWIEKSDFLARFEPVPDMVNHPPHYKDASGVGCTEVVKHMMFFSGSCFKYLYRCGNKWDDIGDLKKAVRCAELANDDRFITDESWLRAMYQVASHRDGHIRDAMFAIRCQQWTDVIDCILAEIARLESE